MPLSPHNDDQPDEPPKTTFKASEHYFGTLGTAVCRRFSQLQNHNVRVLLVSRCFDSVAWGIWGYTVLSAYIYFLTSGSNKLVGVAEGIQGIFVPLAALPAGWAGDRMRRDHLLKSFGITAALAIFFTSWSALAPELLLPLNVMGRNLDLRFVVLVVGLIFWGISQGGSSVQEAIFADSTPTGGRSDIYTTMYSSSLACAALGNLIACGIFALNSNQWTIRALQHAVLVGMIVSVVPTFCLFLFDESKVLGKESDAAEDGEAPDVRDCEEGGSATDSEPAVKRLECELSCCGMRLTSAWIPYVLAASDCISGLASGCTIKFFPLFFLEALKYAPVGVNLILACSPFFISIASYGAQLLSQRIGRAQTMVLARTIGVSSLAIMGAFTGLWRLPWLIVPLFLLRTSANNSTYPIQKSILMDYVPKSTRARWNSFESVMSFGWSGSAVVGGWLIDAGGFDLNFIVTAALQAVAGLMTLPLLALVPIQESALKRTPSQAAAAAAAEPGGELHEPLLAHEAESAPADEQAGGLASGSEGPSARTAALLGAVAAESMCGSTPRNSLDYAAAMLAGDAAADNGGSLCKAVDALLSSSPPPGGDGLTARVGT